MKSEAYKIKTGIKTLVIKNPGDYYFDGEDGSRITRIYYILNDKDAGMPNPYYKKTIGPLGSAFPNILNNIKTIAPQGHAAIIFEKSDGSAIYYTWGTTQKLNSKQILEIAMNKPYPGILNRRDLSPEHFQKFRNSGEIPLFKEEVSEKLEKPIYTRYLSVPVKEENGKIIYREAQKILNGEGKKYNKESYLYNLYYNNCNQNVQKILHPSGLSFTDIEPPKGLINMIKSATAGLSFTGAEPHKGLKSAIKSAVKALGDSLMTSPIVDTFGIRPKDAYYAGKRKWKSIDGFKSGKF